MTDTQSASTETQAVAPVVGGQIHSNPDYEALRPHVTIHEDDPKPEDHRMFFAADTHGMFACVKGGVVVNTIIIDTTDTETIALFKGQFDDLVLIQHPGAGSPGMGWLQSAPGQPLTPPPAPPLLMANPATIPPDNTTASVVTYTDTTDNAPTEVVFVVNGTNSAPQPVTNGIATLSVTSQTAGDTITVKVGDLVTMIEVSAT